MKSKEWISYLVFGVLTTVVNLLVYYLLGAAFLNAQDAMQLQIMNVAAWIAAVTFAYFTNRTFVFRSSNPNQTKEAVLFYISRIGTLLLEMGMMFLLVSLLQFNDKISKAVVQGLVIIANYVLSKLVVFRKKQA